MSENVLKGLGEREPFWLEQSLLQVLRGFIHSLEEGDLQIQSQFPWENPWVLCSYPVRWDLQDNRVRLPVLREQDVEQQTPAFWERCRVIALYAATRGLGFAGAPASSTPFVQGAPPDLSDSQLTLLLQNFFTAGLIETEVVTAEGYGIRPYHAPGPADSVSPAGQQLTIDPCVTEAELGPLRQVLEPRLRFKEPQPGSIVFQFWGLFLEPESLEGRYVVAVGVSFDGGAQVDLSEWHLGQRCEFWRAIEESLSFEALLPKLEGHQDLRRENMRRQERMLAKAQAALNRIGQRYLEDREWLSASDKQRGGIGLPPIDGPVFTFGGDRKPRDRRQVQARDRDKSRFTVWLSKNRKNRGKAKTTLDAWLKTDPEYKDLPQDEKSRIVESLRRAHVYDSMWKESRLLAKGSKRFPH